MNGWYWRMLQNFLNTIKQATAGIVSPRLSTSSSQPRFTASLCLGISQPSRSSSHLRLLYSSGRVLLGKTQVGADLGFQHSGNPMASAPSGQLQTTSEHHHAALAQLILHRGQRMVVSGHSQLLQLTGLGKSLPLTCQQQPRLNYKRRVYSAHTEGHLEYQAWVIGEAVSLDPTGYLLH